MFLYRPDRTAPIGERNTVAVVPNDRLLRSNLRLARPFTASPVDAPHVSSRILAASYSPVFAQADSRKDTSIAADQSLRTYTTVQCDRGPKPVLIMHVRECLLNEFKKQNR